MKTVENYLRHGEECDTLAKTAVSEEQRQMIVRMAENWRLLAAQREAHLQARAKIDAIDTGAPAATAKPTDKDSR